MHLERSTKVTETRGGKVGKGDEAVITEIASTIRDYLVTHPHAADTVEGIATWWLIQQRYEYALEEVEQALEQLVSSGLVKKVQGNGHWVYMCVETGTDQSS